MKVVVVILSILIAFVYGEHVVSGSDAITAHQFPIAQRRQDSNNKQEVKQPQPQKQLQTKQQQQHEQSRPIHLQQKQEQQQEQKRQERQISRAAGTSPIFDQSQGRVVRVQPVAQASRLRPSVVNFSGINGGQQARRQGRQENVNGGVDFSGCTTDPDTGLCCVEEEETTNSLQSDPILECTHKNVEKCHYTYVTRFNPAQEEICEENFEKICQITFKQEAVDEDVRKCYRPLIKNCNGEGPEECRTVFESSCTTRYIEKQPGRFVGDTTCEKLPVEICGAGCTTDEGPEECHDKTITSLVDVPEEQCDLNPQQTCRFQTKLVPSLAPEHECTIVPQEICNLRFSQPEQVEKPLTTRWCLDPTPSTPGETYEESQALTSPLGR